MLILTVSVYLFFLNLRLPDIHNDAAAPKITQLVVIPSQHLAMVNAAGPQAAMWTRIQQEMGDYKQPEPHVETWTENVRTQNCPVKR